MAESLGSLDGKERVRGFGMLLVFFRTDLIESLAGGDLFAYHLLRPHHPHPFIPKSPYYSTYDLSTCSFANQHLMEIRLGATKSFRTSISHALSEPLSAHQKSIID